jgi:chromosome segregation ATPase
VEERQALPARPSALRHQGAQQLPGKAAPCIKPYPSANRRDTLFATSGDYTMSEKVENLIIEHLKSIRTSIDKNTQELGDLKHRVGSLETKMTLIEKGITNIHEDIALVHARIDRVESRIERIEKRLELVSA